MTVCALDYHLCSQAMTNYVLDSLCWSFNAFLPQTLIPGSMLYSGMIAHRAAQLP